MTETGWRALMLFLWLLLAFCSTLAFVALFSTVSSCGCSGPVKSYNQIPEMR